jgi:hypothetical protein
MVAQGPLEALVMVRIHAGQPHVNFHQTYTTPDAILAEASSIEFTPMRVPLRNRPFGRQADAPRS